MSSSQAQNFYLAGLSTNVNPTTPATFFSPVLPVNFTDYSANAICRMKLSVAKNMFQFWSKSADLSQNSLADLAFRVMYDPSSGFAVNDSSANPMSLDFTLGTIVTWSDPSNLQMNVFSQNGSNYQTLFPQAYLRYLAYLIFQNPDATSNFLNPTAVMDSVNSQSKSSLDATLKGLTAYVYTNSNGVSTSDNIGRQWNYLNYQVDPQTYNVISSVSPTNPTTNDSNPSSRIFQQIRTNVPSRISNINPITEKIVDASSSTYPNGAWYKMPFVAGDSIYFILTINVPTNQKNSNETSLANTPRKYRIRMFIMDDQVLTSQTTDGNTNPIPYGLFGIYPNGNSKVSVGYSYADTISNGTTIDDANDIKPPGP
jgi:hypothetical protein